MFDDPIREFLKEFSAGSPTVWAVFVVGTVGVLTFALHHLLEGLLHLTKRLRHVQK